MRKIGELNTKAGIIVIYHDESAKENPYKVYHKYWNAGWHKKLIVRYADLLSCTAWIHNFVLRQAC